MIGTPENIATKIPRRGKASRERKSADEKETADKNGAAGKGIVRSAFLGKSEEGHIPRLLDCLGNRALMM